MKGKIFNRIISTVVSFAIIASLSINITSAAKLKDNINLKRNEINYVEYDEKVKNKLYEGITLIDNYEKNVTDYTKLYEAIDIFVECNTLLNYDGIKSHEKDDQFDYIYHKITDLMITDRSEEANKVLIYLSDSLYKAMAKRMNNGDAYEFIFSDHAFWAYVHADSKQGLIYKNTSRKTSAVIRTTYVTIERMLKGGQTGPIDENYKPSEKLDPGYSDYIPPYEKPEDGLDDPDDPVDPFEPTPEPPEPEPTPPPTPEPIDPNDPDDSKKNYENRYYEKRGNQCYVIIEKSVDGVVTTNEEIAPVNKLSYCNIYNLDKPSSESYSYGGAGGVYINSKYDTRKKLSDNTIQFTLEKSKGKDAYFYDTSIRVTEDSKVEYKTLKNVYRFIATNVNSNYIKDTDAVMTIVGGKPYYLVDREEEYTKEEIEGLFNKSDDVSITIDKAKSRIKSSVDEEKNVQKLYYEGKELEFANKIQNEGSLIVYPLEEICKKLGAIYTKEDKKITMELGDKNVIYYLDSRRVINNGQIREISVTTKEKDGIVYGQISDLLTGLGFDSKVEGDVLKIEKAKDE